MISLLSPLPIHCSFHYPFPPYRHSRTYTHSITSTPSHPHTCFLIHMLFEVVCNKYVAKEGLRHIYFDPAHRGHVVDQCGVKSIDQQIYPQGRGTNSRAPPSLTRYSSPKTPAGPTFMCLEHHTGVVRRQYGIYG